MILTQQVGYYGCKVCEEYVQYYMEVQTSMQRDKENGSG